MVEPARRCGAVTEAEARAVATAWLDAWSSGDADRVLALLHDEAVIADPVAGKVRPTAIADHVRSALAERSPVCERWSAHPGADSVAVVCELAGGAVLVDILVLAEDGRIVRVMRHHS